MENINVLERIDSFLKIEPYLESETKNKIMKELNISEDNILKRGFGKIKEIELELIMLFSNKCKTIIPLGEELAVIDGEKIPDYLIFMENNDVVLIEVKNTSKEKISISNNYITKQKEYAKKLNAKLYYAVSIRGTWLLFNSEFLIEKENKITIDDIKYSEFSKFFNFKTYGIESHFWIEETFDIRESIESPIGIIDIKYGNLIRFKFGYRNNLILDSEEFDSFNLIDMQNFFVAWSNIFDGMRRNQFVKNQNGYHITVKSILKERSIITPVIAIIDSFFRSNNYDYKTVLYYKSLITDNKEYNEDLVQEINKEFDELKILGYPISEVKENQIKLDCKFI
ncbi:MAG: hypothetical protein ACRCVJ_01120 [Clostridium sp.]|uniref:hypothetical protein n=1 Tax=Clostridium sp. TaxID=1506 RepID=UPI003F37457E